MPSIPWKALAARALHWLAEKIPEEIEKEAERRRQTKPPDAPVMRFLGR